MPRPTYGARLPMTVGLLALSMLVGGVGYWSVQTEISGAIISSGMVVVENNRQVVQHAEGGIVDQISARDGDRVEAGATLIVLDDSLLRSELAVAELQILELQARRARLEAERDEAGTLVFSDGLLMRTSTNARSQIDGQRVLFEARKETFEKEVSRIRERVRQIENQIAGTKAQLTAFAVQADLTDAELIKQEEALSRGLTQAVQVLALRREAAQIAGTVGQLQSDVARLRGEITELEIEQVRLHNARREQAITSLRDIQFRELELTEQRQSLLKRLDRLHIRAPVSGVVYGATVFAENAVVRAAEPLMYLVPEDRPLIVNARVDAIHIDQVRVGQDATLRLSAFNQRLTPELGARVIAVSADVLEDVASGAPFYRVDLAPSAAELAKLEGQTLLPGMPVEVFLRTDARTPLSYLTKPLTDYFGRAFRES